MPTNNIFISKSIDLHLFFMRITEEHLIFILQALSPLNSDLSREAKALRNEALNFLCLIMSISNGHVSQEALSSNELTTKYTYNAEKLTEYYTGLQIYSNLTLNEQYILTTVNMMYKPISNNQMLVLNKYAIDITNRIIAFQSRLFQSISKCEIFVNIYPDRLDHIIEENRRYVEDIQALQNMNLISTLYSINDQMIFWNENMSDHGEFTAHLLDPKEKELVKISLEFGDVFDKLANDAKNATNNPNEITNVMNKSLQELIKYKEFYVQVVIDIMNCKVKSMILPLPAEHDLREVNHYLRILYEGKKL